MLERREKRANGSRRVVQVCEGVSKTEQCHANEVNINSIVSRYQKTGFLPLAGGSPRYGDFTGVEDYHSACEAVREAEAGFMTLPPEVRKRFANDPGELLDFLSDEKNLDEAVKLGLVERVVSDEPPIVNVDAPVVSQDGTKPA